MKSILIPACLSLLCASAFALEPTAVPAGTCVAPVFPTQSTSLVSVKSLHSAFNQWRTCVAAQPTEENLRADADVRQKAMAWQRATNLYLNREGERSQDPYHSIMGARNDGGRLDNERRVGGGHQEFVRDRLTNDVVER
jgi:hypothetical protein